MDGLQELQLLPASLPSQLRKQAGMLSHDRNRQSDPDKRRTHCQAQRGSVLIVQQVQQVASPALHAAHAQEVHVGSPARRP